MFLNLNIEELTIKGNVSFVNYDSKGVENQEETPLNSANASNGVNVDDVVAAIETFISDLGKNARRVPYE